MTFKEKLAILALLLVARICAPEPFAKQIEELASSIRLWATELK